MPVSSPLSEYSVDYFGPGARFAHVGLAVRQLPLTPGPVFDDPVQRVQVSFADVHGINVEFVASGAKESPIANYLAKGGGVYHLCYSVPDLDAAVVYARAKGFVAISRPVPAVAFENRRIVWLFNAHCGLFELVEQEAKVSATGIGAAIRALR